MKANHFKALVRANISGLNPYRSARDEFRGDARFYLDANESPFPSAYRRYPDAQQERLRSAVSRLKKVTPDEVLLTNGSDEGIDLIIRAFCEPKVSSVIIPQPTYGMYATFAAINDVKVLPVPLTKAFDLDMAAIRKRCSKQTRIVFLCSPNNPTGNLLTKASVRTLLELFKGLVVIDEAYNEFSDSISWAGQIRKYPNLIVLHTFSKAWGLAGLRVGVCLAHPQIIRVLNLIKAPYNVSSASEKALLHTLANKSGRITRQVATVVKEREKMKKALANLPIVREVFPSAANFLLVRVRNAKIVYKALLNRGIVVRQRSDALRCENCLRLTIGTPAQNRKLLAILKSL